MSPRSSLLKRAAVPLLAVTAATLTASLCAPARAATASWAYCQSGIDPYYGKVVYEQVECVVADGNSEWNMDVIHNNRLGGGDDNTAQTSPDVVGSGDFFDPIDGHYPNPVHSTGTYNCWSICSGFFYEGPNVNQTWNASTGGTKYVTF